MAVHGAMVDRMDQGIGRLIRKLEETGELENTLILFLSDNDASYEDPTRFRPGFDRAGSTRDGREVLFPVDREVLPGPQTTHTGIGARWGERAEHAGSPEALKGSMMNDLAAARRGLLPGLLLSTMLAPLAVASAGAQAHGPAIAAAVESVAAGAIDGQVDFSPTAPWTPLLEVDWESGAARTEAWIRPGWSERGLRLSFFLPNARDTDRMDTGRTPAAPFVLNFAFGGGKGMYEVRCVPLVEPVTRMTMRHHAYLFNHRLGANARLGEGGHAFCQETTRLGILPDSLETRWSAAAGGGLQFEALVPWRTLRLSSPRAGAELPFRIRVTRPEGRVAEWGEGDGMGRLRLAAEGEEGEEDLWPLVPATAVRQPEPLPVILPASPSTAGVELALIDNSGRISSRASAVSAGDAVVARLETRGLPDGAYTLRVTRNGTSRGERTVHLLGGAARAEVDRPGATLARRLDLVEARADPAWMAGHIARARAALRLAALPSRLSPADLYRSRGLIADASAIADALEAGRRPAPSREGFWHDVGFALDGRRGPVTFVPTDAPRARLTVEAGRETEWELTPFLYGTFSEPVVFDRPIYSMLYAQALRNPSFEFGHPSAEETVEAFVRYEELEPVAARAALSGEWLRRVPASIEEVAAPWVAVGNGTARFETECDHAYNDRSCQRIIASAGARDVGIAQVITLPAWRTTRYRLRGFLRSDGTVDAARAVLLHDGRPVSTVPLGRIGNDWQEFEAELRTPRVEGPLNTFMLALLFDGPGRLDVDLVGLYPIDAVDGFDPQAIEQLRALRTGWIRWPGGNLASGYDWREAVGPRDQRPSLPNPSWPGLSSNFVGTDEFLRLNHLVGSEPMITVNAGDGSAEEAAQWVEYVNGSPDTPMGRLRAQNGHPEPYGVRYWNIGNELWGNWQIGYIDPEGHARRYADFARAMKAVDPSIRLIAIGQGGHSIGHPDPWNEPLLDYVGEDLDILDLHTYVGVPPDNLTATEQAFLLSAIPLSYEQWLMGFRRELLGRGLDHVRLIVGEYNGRIRTESEEINRIADLLLYAGYLHVFARQGEYVIGANATEFSPFDPRALPFGRMHPRYDLFRTYARHAGTKPVEAVLEAPVHQQERRLGRDVIPMFNLPLVDAVVLKDPQDGSLGVSLINRSLEDSLPVEIELRGFAPHPDARWYLFGAAVSGGVREERVPVSESFTITLPPHSVSLLKLQPKAPAR